MLAALGCQREIPPEERVDNGWELARKALTGGPTCFAGRAEYCITDPAFVDGAIRVRLDELYGGEMPKRRAHVDATILNATILYKKGLMRPEQVAVVEELVKEHYFNPSVTVNGDTVSVDLGVVPGALEPRVTTSTLALVKSDYAIAGEWLDSERAQRLSEYVAKYPDKAIVRVAVTVPLADQLATFSYRYVRSESRVVVTNGTGEMRTTKRNVTDAELRSGKLPLGFSALTACRASRTPGPQDQDPPRVCPPDDLHPSVAEAP